MFVFNHFTIDTPMIWMIIGFIGQGLFFMRFFVQWLASERAKKSVIPNAFWYFSIAGGLILLIYAIYKQDPVFILGSATGFLIYSRNIYFIRKNGKLRGESESE